ncbi:hypothetical protein FACS1894189_6420 [Planctomycetales bacterium]|nr:hypothetical protein FACS1894189_6420 [Planctomycetales bacterium]
MKHFTALLILILLAGCSGKVGLHGKVTYSDDGSPLGTGMVCFVKEGYIARGNIMPDGSYVIGSASEKDGLPRGKYQVYIAYAVRGTDPEQVEMLIDPKFSDAATSGLSVDINGSTKYDIQVERFKPFNKE